jgi:UPF0716 protein FxsA
MKIPGYILILFPVLELVIFIEVGSYIGSLNVILSIFFTIFLGIYLIKSRLRSIKLNLFDIRNLQDIDKQYSTNIYSLFAGVLLIIPGFLTDALGIVLLIPFFRPQIFKYFKTNNNSGNTGSNKSNVIDGDYRNDD